MERPVTNIPRSVRRDAVRSVRDRTSLGSYDPAGARAPHFTRELEELHPDNPVNNTGQAP
ncbi:MAG: hypothetical protein WBW41_00105 [Verrucomicrobiia bacterium]